MSLILHYKHDKRLNESSCFRVLEVASQELQAGENLDIVMKKILFIDSLQDNEEKT